MRRFFRQISILLFVIGLLPLAGCVGTVLKSPTPTPDAMLTEVAKSIEALREELARVAPTLTAIASYTPPVNTLQPTYTSLPEASATPTSVKTQKPTATRTSPAAQSTAASPTVQPAIASPTTQPAVVSPTVQPKSASPTALPVLTTPTTRIDSPTPIAVSSVILALAAPTPVAQASSVIFQDNFTDKPGWFTNRTDTYTLEFIKGGYHFLVLSMKNPIWSVRSNAYDDVRIEVDAAQTAGPSDGYYGLICRQEDDDNYYILVISPDGTYGIGKVKRGDLNFLALSDGNAGRLSPLGNRLRADCVGKNLSLYVNGTKVLEAIDSDFVSGQVGMVVGNRSTPGTDVQFDNFIVLKP